MLCACEWQCIAGSLHCSQRADPLKGENLQGKHLITISGYQRSLITQSASLRIVTWQDAACPPHLTDPTFSCDDDESLWQVSPCPGKGCHPPHHCWNPAESALPDLRAFPRVCHTKIAEAEAACSHLPFLPSNCALL